MNDIFRITIKIADVEPFQIEVKREEEKIYRKAVDLINRTWNQLRQSNKNESSHFVLAKTALSVGELYYRKSGEIEAQSRMIDDFEKQLDKLLEADKG